MPPPHLAAKHALAVQPPAPDGAAEQIPDAAHIYRVACSAMDSGVIVMSMRGRILWANPAYCRMIGHDLNAIVGRNPYEFAVPEDMRPAPEVIHAFHFKKPRTGKPHAAKIRAMRKGGEAFWAQLNTTFDHLPDYGDVAVVVAHDLGQNNLHEHRSPADGAVAHDPLAQVDPLTGLFNRRGAMEALKASVGSSDRPDRKIGLMNIDIDHFKTLNDKHGHAVGDAILRHIASCLKTGFGPDSVTARIGGDEFLVLSDSVPSEEAFATLGNDLITTALAPVSVGKAVLSTKLSVGAAVAAAEGLVPDELLRRASFALYDAKQRGAGQVTIYDKSLHDQKQFDELLASDLREALEADRMSFAFQPTYNAALRAVKGFETLVRWHNPRLGLVSPAEFLPIAEEAGLLAQLDKAAFLAAIDLKHRLTEAGYEDIRVAFNGSADFLSQDNFVEMYLETLAHHRVAPGDILIEVLESVVFHDVTDQNPLVRVVKDLHEAGVTLLLDDFGTGYAGLTHLANLAVSGVKIDRSLTKNILTDNTSAKIMSMMIDLCRDLDLYVVTEGVETQDELAALLRLGGTMVQGYWLAKAMTADEAIDWLEARAA